MITFLRDTYRNSNGVINAQKQQNLRTGLQNWVYLKEVVARMEVVGRGPE